VTGLLPHLDDIASEIAERMRPGASDKRAIFERPHLPECVCSLLPAACPTGASLRRVGPRDSVPQGAPVALEWTRTGLRRRECCSPTPLEGQAP